MPALLRSHPLPESRIAALRREAETLRAAPHPAPRVAAAPPLPAPAEPPPLPSPVAGSELFPLAVGMSWIYRVSEPAGADPGKDPQVFTTSVIEEQPGHTGLFRVRTELDAGLASTRLLTVTTSGVFALKDAGREATDERGRAGHALQLSALGPRPGSPPTWQPEISLPTSLPDKNALEDWETVRVPAGEYRAIRAVQRSAAGETATVWLAPGVGIVRRAWERTGLVEELESFHRPAPEQDRNAAAPKTGS
jgi:hypothetical protein